MKTSAGGTFEVDNGVIQVEFSGSKAEMDVFEGKGLVGASAVFRRAAQEGESNADSVSKRSRFEGHGQVGAMGAVEEELDQ